MTLDYNDFKLTIAVTPKAPYHTTISKLIDSKLYTFELPIKSLEELHTLQTNLLSNDNTFKVFSENYHTVKGLEDRTLEDNEEIE